MGYEAHQSLLQGVWLTLQVDKHPVGAAAAAERQAQAVSWAALCVEIEV